MGQVGLEPTTGGLGEARPPAPRTLAAQMTRVIALMALAALGLCGTPVHEPVHGRWQAISVVVTQRSGPSSGTVMAHLTIWLGEI